MIKDKIEELCLLHKVYDYNEKTKLKHDIIKCLNEMIDSCGNDGLYIFCPTANSSICFYQILFFENRQKFDILRDKGLKISGMLNHIFVRKNIGRCRYIIDTYRNPSWKRWIKKIILELINGCKVINIYQYLQSRGYVFDADWNVDLGLVYDEVYSDYARYQNSKGTNDEKTSIKRLIGDYLEIRDFINAEKWIRSLAERYGNQDTDVIEYCKLWGGIQSYLYDIKEKISGKEHIVVNWVDALRYDEVSNMPYLSKRVEEGISFEKMYVPTPYTNAAAKAVIMGKYIIDDKAFALKGNDYKQGKLWKCLETYGYQLIFSGPAFHTGSFYNAQCSILHSMYDRAMIPSTIVQFDAICNMAEAGNKKYFYIIQNSAETHYPYLNPITETKRIKCFLSCDNADEKMSQILQSQLYLDEQLQYYNRFYENARCQIYMSDHGQLRAVAEPICIEGTHHVVFSVCPRKPIQDRIYSVTSLINFTELVEKLLQDDYDGLKELNTKDYVLIQMDDVYGEERRKTVENDRLTNGLSYQQYRGVVTKQDSYVRTVTGQEFYFRNAESTNLIKDDQYKDRISYLRELAGNKYIDINREDKYKEARLLYQNMNWTVESDIQFLD